MAKKQKYTLDEGREMIFSTKKLNKCFKMYEIKSKKQDAKISKENIRQEIADKCCVSESAIKHWILGHNAPGDYDKVKDLAKALGVSAEDLLEKENESSEEKNDMNNIITENKIDYSTTKSVVRDLYMEIVGYIEMYRTARDCTYKTDSSALKLMFRNLYISLTKAKLDLPREMFYELRSFAINYLQQMGCYCSFQEKVFEGNVDFEEIGLEDWEDTSIWWSVYIDGTMHDGFMQEDWSENKYVEIDFECEDSKLFEEAMKADVKYQEAYNEFMEDPKELFISQAAYKRLDEILKDYIPD